MPRYNRLKNVFLKEALSGAKPPDDLVWNDSLFRGLVDDYLAAKDEDDRLVALHSLSSLLYIAADDAHRVGDSKIEFLLRRVENLNPSRHMPGSAHKAAPSPKI